VGKYDGLRDHLAAQPSEVEELSLTFGEVESIVGLLPSSARVHRAWWSNDSKVEAEAWRAAGWHVKAIDQSAERVVFARGQVGGTRAVRLAAEDRRSRLTSPAPADETRQSDLPRPAAPGPSRTRRKVFLVHGRHLDARRSVVELLRAFDLRVIGWEEAAAQTGRATPYTGDVVAAGMDLADAVVVLFTPDDLGCVRHAFRRPGDGREELELTGQARQNVVFEAGMAMARDRDKVVLVEIGQVRPMTDTAGLNVVRLTDSFSSRRQLAARLRSAGLDVDTDNDDWPTAGSFVWPEAESVLSRVGTSSAQQATSAAHTETRPGSRSGAYMRFWERFLSRLASEGTNWTRTRKVPAENWLPLPAGMSGVIYNCSFGRKGLCSEIFFEDPDPSVNEARFTAASAKRDVLEKAYGMQLTFEPLIGRKGCRIADYRPGDIDQFDEWQIYIDWFYSTQSRLRNAVVAAGGLRALIADD
jgi:predicted nucleotide-binding protein